MIGVFDSGLGGLTVLSAFLKRFPQYSYMYLGDNKRAPYGDKTASDIYYYTRAGIDYLFKQGCTLVIVACNTASAVALRKIQQEHLPQNYSQEYRVLGVIRPVVEAVAELLKKEPKQLGSREARIGIIGTRATIASRAYETELKKQGLNIEIRSRACPRLVPLIESGLATSKPRALDGVLRECLRGYEDLDHLILGCTHYSIIEQEIKNYLASTKVFSTPLAVCDKLADYIERHPEIEISSSGVRKIYISGNLEKTAANLFNYFKDLSKLEITKAKAFD